MNIKYFVAIIFILLLSCTNHKLYHDNNLYYNSALGYYYYDKDCDNIKEDSVQYLVAKIDVVDNHVFNCIDSILDFSRKHLIKYDSIAPFCGFIMKNYHERNIIMINNSLDGYNSSIGYMAKYLNKGGLFYYRNIPFLVEGEDVIRNGSFARSADYYILHEKKIKCGNQILLLYDKTDYTGYYTSDKFGIFLDSIIFTRMHVDFKDDTYKWP